MSKHRKYYIILSSIFALVSILVLGVEVFAFFSISNIQANLREQQYRLQKLSDEKKNLELLDVKYQKIEGDLSKINTALPDKKDASKLVSDLDSLASDAGLKLTLVQSATYGKKQSTATDPSLLQTIKGNYGYELPLEIRVTGSFQNFNSFITRLENYQRLINVNNLEITKIDEDTGPVDQIEAKLKLTAYLKK